MPTVDGSAADGIGAGGIVNIGPFAVPGYHVGDCRELLRQVPDGSINCCVTSPPYWGLRDYGVDGQLGLEQTPAEYVAGMVEVFREVRRALRDDGTCWVNLGDSYAAGHGGRRDCGRDIGGRGGNYQDERPDEHVKRDVPDGLKPKDLVGIPWRVAFALQADGWYLRSDIIWSKPNPMPESVTDRPTKAHEYMFLLAKSERYYYDADAIKDRALGPGLVRRDKHQEYRAINGSPKDGTVTADTRNARSVWSVSTEPTPDAHFATYPRKLVEPCILAGCPAGGVVLDPFGGSGTTGRVAEDHGRNWLLFDLNPKYAAIAKRKTAQTGLLRLFAGVG
jgi:DNA modification methylase